MYILDLITTYSLNAKMRFIGRGCDNIEEMGFGKHVRSFFIEPENFG